MNLPKEMPANLTHLCFGAETEIILPETGLQRLSFKLEPCGSIGGLVFYLPVDVKWQIGEIYLHDVNWTLYRKIDKLPNGIVCHTFDPIPNRSSTAQWTVSLAVKGKARERGNLTIAQLWVGD